MLKWITEPLRTYSKFKRILHIYNGREVHYPLWRKAWLAATEAVLLTDEMLDTREYIESCQEEILVAFMD